MIGRNSDYDNMFEMSNNRDKLCVVSVAILTRYGLICSLPAPNRHHHVVNVLVAKFDHMDDGHDEQGFLLSDGTFCGRKPAKLIAEKAGQLLERASKLAELFSEDVW